MTVKICLLKSNNDFDMEYTYIVPDEMTSEIDVGVFVDVPFGTYNSTRVGVVTQMDSEGDFFIPENDKGKPVKLKAIKEIIKKRPPLTSEQLLLCKAMRERYLCSMGKIISLMLPPELSPKGKFKVVRLSVSPEQASELLSGNKIRSIKQIKVIEELLSADDCELPCEELKREFDIQSPIISALAKKGIVTIDLREGETLSTNQPSDAKFESEINYPEKTLNDEQRIALEKIVCCIEKGNGCGMLLHGITGSGKTEVYMHAIKHAIKNGGSAILLVPEISLTPQIVARFKGRFGEKTAVLHSRLTPVQKRNEYERIRRGEVDIVIGARSAVFAPCKNLKLIILDEEQEPSYKSFDSVPYYNSSEVAFMRARICNSAVILGSATPSVTTYFKAMNGEIDYASLTKRAAGGKLPEVTIINMRDESRKGNFSLFSAEMLYAMQKNYEEGKQTILFVPRRGFSGRLICGGCGKAMTCKKCRVPMTYHKGMGRLVCHYCGNTVTAPEVCPSCGYKGFNTRTVGTEMVEAEIKRLFPEARTVRMDADTTSGKEGHRVLLEKFEKEKIPFLIGTQMIAKGLDFPNVTLVGVLNADGLLNIQSYDASERAFQLLTQVFGRAGRSEYEGRGILQTVNDDELVYACAVRQDYNAFYNNELEFRRAMHYPPFSVMCTVTVSGTDDKGAFNLSNELCKSLKKLAQDTSGCCENIEIFNVTRDVMPKVNDRFRWIFNLKSDTMEGMLGIMSDFAYKILPKIKQSIKKNFRINFDIEA